MKLALLADIHGNAFALDAVLTAAAVEGAEHALVAGDLVGYYYQPDRVLARLDAFGWTGVRGNHEDMLETWLADEGRDDIARRYGSGLAVAAERLDAMTVARLRELPPHRSLTLGGRRVLLCHGTPSSTDTYVYPDADTQVKRAFEVPGHDLVVYGHTHYQTMWRAETTGGLVVNPGSVGQPRDRRPGAHWAVYDTDSNTIDLRVETYDAGALLVECRTRNPHLPYLADVLVRDRS